jgi:hypothetical protein
MSIADERDLSERLSGVLDAITPSPAPLGAAVRSGKLIRARRNLGIAAGLAVAAGFVVAAPGLLHHPAHPGGSAVRPTVMVRQLCPGVPDGAHWLEHKSNVAVSRAGWPPAADLVADRCAWLVP